MICFNIECTECGWHGWISAAHLESTRYQCPRYHPPPPHAFIVSADTKRCAICTFLPSAAIHNDRI